MSLPKSLTEEKTITVELTELEYSEMVSKLANELEHYGSEAAPFLKSAFKKLADKREDFNYEPTSLFEKHLKLINQKWNDIYSKVIGRS